jgi:hypothetical protein
MYSASLAHAKVPVTWEAIMSRTDLLEQSATRVELDQRSREARLRLERVERLLMLRRSPKQSLLGRVLRCFGSRVYVGEQIAGRSTNGTLTGGRSRGRRRMTKETGCARGGLSAASPFSWPIPTNCSVMNMVGSGPAEMEDPQAMRRRITPWSYACRRVDFGFPALSDDRF